MIGKAISHYRILEELGGGGMGMVYKAKDTKLGLIVTVKFLPKHLLWGEQTKTRFVQKTKAASALDHPDITAIREIEEAESGRPVYMEHVEGKPIKQFLFVTGTPQMNPDVREVEVGKGNERGVGCQ